jgi:hypothetical protein
MRKCAKLLANMNRGWFLALGVVAMTSAAHAQFSLSGGVFAPRSSAVRSVFGNNSFSPGFGFGDPMRRGRAGAGFDFAGLSLNAPGNRFFGIGGTFGYEVQFGQDTSSLKYARVGTGLGYYDYDLSALSLGNQSGRTVRSLTALEAGIVLNNQFTISAQYLIVPKIGGVDFSGMRLQAMFTIRR